MHDFPLCLFNPAFRGCQNPINGLTAAGAGAALQLQARSAATHRSTALSSRRGQCYVVSRGTRLDTDLLLFRTLHGA